MKRRKVIGIIAGILVLGAGAGAAAAYLFSDRTPPELEVVSTYRVECGKPVPVEELIVEVRDQSSYTLTLSGDGEVQEDGQSIRFPRPGEFAVLVEAKDASGRTTRKSVPVTARDITPPELQVQDIVVELGESFEYQDAVTATDPEEGDLTAQVQVDDSLVKADKVGTYSVIYSVEDSSGNRTEERGRVMIQPVQATQIVLDQAELNLSGNQHADLHATVLPENWEGTVEWSSSNPDVATVSDGMVAWAGQGTCVITAQADGQSAACQVTCDEVKATSIRLSQETVNLDLGDVATLETDTSPSNWKGEVIWTSSDEQVATVEDGAVTAVGEGTCIITAAAGDVTAQCQVTCRRTVLDNMSDMWHDFLS